jgi:RNA polymerase sigma-70 factor (ECF subfamily)
MEGVFRLLRDSLLRYVGSIVRDPTLAHDLVQDVFVALWEARTTLDPAQPLRPYIYRMARNRALRHLRDARTHARKEEVLKRTVGALSPNGMETAFDTATLHRHVRRWLDDLPERQREALMLSRLHQLSHREIAAVMTISPRTVNNHIMRALDHLQQRMQAFEATL